MYHYTYEITNKTNYMYYFGVRSCECLPEYDNYMGSGSYLKEAIKSEGIENFRKKIISIYDTRDEAERAEQAILIIRKSVEDPMCYNLTDIYMSVSFNGMKKKRISCEGIQFKTHEAAAKYFGITKSQVWCRLKGSKYKDWYTINKFSDHSNDVIHVDDIEGKVRDPKTFRKFNRRAVIGPDGTKYESISAAALANNVCNQNIHYWLNSNKGWSYE